jgi:hypothetical protein
LRIENGIEKRGRRKGCSNLQSRVFQCIASRRGLQLPMIRSIAFGSTHRGEVSTWKRGRFRSIRLFSGRAKSWAEKTS